jgi:hypothetical protein
LKEPRGGIEVPFEGVRICKISTNALHFNIKRSNIEFFWTSLYEIDRIIEEVVANEDGDTIELI